MAVAYSYIRFSSEKQKLGHSLKRQKDAATLYAHSHELVLDTSTYKDLGVSAFRSKNHIEGALGAFIEAVDSGRIAKGSYLLVESLDRLSRDTIDVALELFLGIIRRGIIIVTLIEPPEVFSQPIIRDNPSKLLVAIVSMWRANEESRTKSERAKAKFQQRVQEGRLPTTRVPTWLKFSEDYTTATLIPERAEIVKQIFQMAINGEGARGIARILNEKKVPVLMKATEWRQSTVSTLLRNKATYGYFKGKKNAVEGAITQWTYERAQGVVDARRLFKGIAASRNPNNIFAGLGRCGHCGRPMGFMPRRGVYYLRCVGAASYRTCPGRMFPFSAVEIALVYELAHRTKRKVGEAWFSKQTARREQIEQDIAIIKERQGKLLRIADLTEGVDAVATELAKSQGEIDKLQDELKTVSAYPLTNREAHENAAILNVYLKLIGEFPDIETYGDTTENIVEFRKKLKAIMGRIIKKIEFLNADIKRWVPQLILTYVNDAKSIVDVSRYLPERTQTQMSHGIYHRADLGTSKKKPKKRKD